MAGKKQVDLTEAQKQCLRLVDRLYTSKEIARELGVSPFTIDQRLDGARRKLNADTRKNAAKIFAASEAEKISDVLVYEAPSIVSTADYANKEASNIQYGGKSDLAALQFTNTGLSQQSLRGLFALPPLGGANHNLTKAQIFVEIIKTATFSTVSVSAAIIVIVGLMRILA